MNIFDIIKKIFHTITLRIFVVVTFILFLLQEKIKSFFSVDVSVILDFFQNNPTGVIFILLVFVFWQSVDKILNDENPEKEFWISCAIVVFIALVICAFFLYNTSKPTQFEKCVESFQYNARDDRSKQNFLDNSDKIIQYCKAIYSKE